MKSATYGAEKRCSNYGLVNLHLCLRQPKHAETPLNKGKSASVKIKENKAKPLSFYNDRENRILWSRFFTTRKNALFIGIAKDLGCLIHSLGTLVL
jgi:hypothetical protein